MAALLLGLLGTVLGFRETLSGAAGASGVLTGFARALTPTAFGLAVAVVLTLGRGYVVNQSESITVQIHEFSARLINALMDRPDVRLGHR